MLDGSWIITNKETGEAVREIFNIDLLPLINHDKYEIETARVYLARTNQEIDNGAR